MSHHGRTRVRNPNRSDESRTNYKFRFVPEPNHSLFFTLLVSAGYLLSYELFFTFFSKSKPLLFSSLQNVGYNGRKLGAG